MSDRNLAIQVLHKLGEIQADLARLDEKWDNVVSWKSDFMDNDFKDVKIGVQDYRNTKRSAIGAVAVLTIVANAMWEFVSKKVGG
jgi:hypothetical protein